MNGRRARIVGAVIVAVLAGACSSDSDRLTKKQYIAKADRICQAANQKTAALAPPSSTDPQALAGFLSKSGQIIADAVAKLKKLQPPKEDEQKINKLVDGLQKSASYFPPLIRAVKARDTQAIQRVAAQLRAASLQGTQIAETYGFHVCAHATSTTATPTP